MILRFYRWRLRRFITPYLKQEKFPYNQADVYLQLVSLMKPFLPHALNYSRHHTQHMVTYYPTVTSWLNETGRVVTDIHRDMFHSRGVIKSMEMTISAFLITDEGYSVDYMSALEAVEKQLDLMYQAVLLPQHDEFKRDYYYRQLEEEFLTGLHFYLTFVQDVLAS